VFSQWGANCSFWPCLKPYYCQTTLVNDPNISGILVTLPNIGKMSLSTLWLSKTSVLHKICSFCTNFVKLFSVKRLRAIHEFCMVNLPYHNEYVKIFSMQIFTAVMGNQGNKGIPNFLVFSFCATFGPRYFTFWVKFQENWRGCPDHFLRIDTEWPSISFFVMPSVTHIGVTKGAQCPRCRITGGHKKSQQCCRYFFHYSTFAPERL